MSTQLPTLVAGLVDDAAVFPPAARRCPTPWRPTGGTGAAWYADLVGPLLLPASAITAGELSGLVDPEENFAIGLIGDTGVDRLPVALSILPPLGVTARQVEVPSRGGARTPNLG